MRKQIILLGTFLLGCTTPVVNPGKANVCTTPFLGDDCLDTYQTFSTFKNGFACNLCQDTDFDKWADGCAWAGKKGDPNYWCVTDCRLCSAVVPTFTKSN